MIDAHTITATLEPLGIALKVKSLDFTLDENAAPYADARLVCSMPTSTDRPLIDMRTTNLRVRLHIRRDYGLLSPIAAITAYLAGSGIAGMTALLASGALSTITNRFYEPWNGASVRPSQILDADLYLWEREFDDGQQELSVTARSDEALLIGDALLSTIPWDPGTTSIASICTQVLSRYGATLTTSVTATVAEVTATIWKPGVTAWKYLDPILEAASLRLWADEQGAWHLTERQSIYDGSVTISTANTMTGNRDRMTLDPDIWYDGVAVEYRWVDALGISQVAYDVAGAQPAKAVLKIEKPNTIYPGPGAAAGILTRGQGRGRVLDVEAVSDYSVRPGFAATISAPDTLAQTGYVSSIRWDLPAAEMDLATRGLIETPLDSYLAGNEATFATVATTAPLLAINAFDWSLV